MKNNQNKAEKAQQRKLISAEKAIEKKLWENEKEKKKEEIVKEKNQRKAMKKYEPAIMADLLPIISLVSPKGSKECYGLMPDGSIIDILQITGKNINNMSDDEFSYDCMKWDKLYMTYPGDIKYIFLNFPVNVAPQLAYIKRKAAKTRNPICLDSLEKEYQLLEAVAGNKTEKEFYLMFYAEDYERYLEAKSKIKGTLNRSGYPILHEIPREKKEMVFFKLNNLNSKITLREDDK